VTSRGSGGIREKGANEAKKGEKEDSDRQSTGSMEKANSYVGLGGKGDWIHPPKKDRRGNLGKENNSGPLSSPGGRAQKEGRKVTNRFSLQCEGGQSGRGPRGESVEKRQPDHRRKPGRGVKNTEPALG